MKPIVFRDQVKVYVRAGDGGDGAATFRREKHVPRGGPDGGDGGDGGHVIFQAHHNIDSLVDLYYKPHQRAEHGVKGRGQRRHGRRGKSIHVKVPCGTTVYEANSGALIGELLEDGEELIVAQGGKGGLGNCHFVTSSHQVPTEFTPGTPGEEKTLRLELKTVADIGLVGHPNAGKSTLLTRLSGAHPKIAPYPFTTLHPIIGTIIFEDYNKLRVADIPGLIEGAHEGVGLGYEFLRHIERTHFLLYIIDMAGTDMRSPVEDFRSLQHELQLYKEELLDLPHLVLANKMDVECAGENLKEFIAETGITPLCISAQDNEGTELLMQTLYDRFFNPSAPGKA